MSTKCIEKGAENIADAKSHKCCKNEKRMTKTKCHTDHFLPGGVQRPPETESKTLLEM